MAGKTLDLIGELRPEVLELVRKLRNDGASEERIAKELFKEFSIDLSRWAVHSWLADEAARTAEAAQ